MDGTNDLWKYVRCGLCENLVLKYIPEVLSEHSGHWIAAGEAFELRNDNWRQPFGKRYCPLCGYNMEEELTNAWRLEFNKHVRDWDK